MPKISMRPIDMDNLIKANKDESGLTKRLLDPNKNVKNKAARSI
jgi:hypothetical protein